MTVFDSLFRASAFPQLLTLHGEAASYRFRDGTVETGSVIINREPNQILDSKGEVFQPKFTVQIEFVDADQVDTGGDKISIKKHPLDVSATEYSVLMIVSQNAGVVELAVG